MICPRKLIGIGMLVFIFLLFFVDMGFASSITNEDILKSYMSSKYNGNILEQRDTLLRFQAENNLLVDGIIGDITKKALAEKKKEIVDIIPKEMENKRWFIVINKTKKILTVYKGGIVYKKYPVALGKPNTPTPSYKFTIINKAKNPYWGGMNGKFKPIKGGAPNNPLGKRWLGISGGKHRGYGIHGNSNPYSIGQYISSGCIRMINEDIDELYEYIPIRTNVWIGTDEQLKEWGVKQEIKYKEIEKTCCVRGLVM